MNKKLLFAAMSLAALTACTDNDFESQKMALAEAEEVGSVQFEVINDALTRASLSEDGNKVVFSATDHDLFTLYHGSVDPNAQANDPVDPNAQANDPVDPNDPNNNNAQAFDFTTGYENATYRAESAEDDTKPATLTTPTMIKEGKAIMVWPADTTFRIKPADALTIKIPAGPDEVQGGKVEVDGVEKETIQYQIPYVSDLIDIEAYAPYSETAPANVIPTAYKTAGKDRKYKIFMRPMASQLNLKAKYVGDAMTTIDELVNDPDDPIKPITLDRVKLLTVDATAFTKEIPLKFSDPGANSQWGTVENHKWVKVTDFNVAGIVGKATQLTTECLEGLDGCKFLILPQAEMVTNGEGLKDAGIVLETYYGNVVIADNGLYGSKYTFQGENPEIKDAWYRFVSSKPENDADGETTKASKETSGDGNGKYLCYSKPEFGLKQTINGFGNYTATSGVAKGEPVGAAAIRYVKVYLKHLDMSNLHIKNDQQLRDVVRVWNALGLDPITVYLDDDKEFESAGKKDFHISQKTIKVINDINTGKTFDKWFKVKPCKVNGEDITQIVITGSDQIQKVQDIAFIASNADVNPAAKAEVVLSDENADENTTTPWIWEEDVKVTAAGVSRIINKGTMLNEETATLRTVENDGTQNYVPLINYGTWNIGVKGQTEGTRLNVQFGVTNMGLVTINKKAQYIQDKTTFNNGASTLPERFLAAGVEEKIGEVDNLGVFATVNNGTINNVGLIEHADKDAKTYITRNQSANDGVNFANSFAANNKMGTINLPYSNKEEDNISISAELAEGFVSVTISDTPATEAPDGGILNEAVVGHKVNYVRIIGGVTEIQQLPAQIKYVEIDEPDTEIVWNLVDNPETVDDPATQEVENDESVATYEGLIVLSDVNIKLNTTIKVTKACYLGADMYVGGYFNPDKTKAQLKTWAGWNGYYGNTTTNFESKYITY